MKTLRVKTDKPYTIYIGKHLLASSIMRELFSTLNKRLVIITDDTLLTTHAQTVAETLRSWQLSVEIFSFAASEQTKTRETKQQLEDRLFAQQYGRDTCLIAIGGGIVTDLVGFLAATYCRSIPVIYMPTTLLAMVDASIGGKTGVNTPFGKNLLGTFTQPYAVLMDTDTLATLPAREFANGMAEVIKHSVIADVALFQRLQQHQGHPDDAFLIDIIYTSCKIKGDIVQQDETEQGRRQLLNFGHTIGHAIEWVENYTIAHGEAVAIGMLVEAYLSVAYGLLAPTIVDSLHTLLIQYGLSLKTSALQQKDAIVHALQLDKKTRNHIPQFVLLTAIGQARYGITVSSQHLEAALAWATDIFDK